MNECETSIAPDVGLLEAATGCVGRSNVTEANAMSVGAEVDA